MDYCSRPVRALYEARVPRERYGEDRYLGNPDFYASPAGSRYLEFENNRPVLAPLEHRRFQL